MLRFSLTLLATRVLTVIPTLFGVIFLTFVVARALPGDPAVYFAGPTASVEAIDKIRQEMGLDKSVPMQFIDYLGDVSRGDLGRSITTGQPVLTDVADRLPASLELTIVALALSLVISIPMGIVASIYANSTYDYIVRSIVTLCGTLPTFFVALLLLFVFYYVLEIAPAPFGRLSLFSIPPDKVTGLYLVDTLLEGNHRVFWESFLQLLLPAISLAMFALAPLTRMTRALMLEVLASDYIRTAKSLGLSNYTVIIRTALRNTIGSMLNNIGMVFSFMLGATVLVEKVYSWPGIGTYAVDAVLTSDFAAVQGFVFAISIVFVITNFLIDLTHSLLDPRTGLEQ